jgi:hypothetical protein
VSTNPGATIQCAACNAELPDEAEFCDLCGHPRRTAAASLAVRSVRLDELITQHVRKGWRVESRSDTQAVVVKGRRVNHVLHFFLTVLTFGLWSVVWAAMVIASREQRLVLSA